MRLIKVSIGVAAVAATRLVSGLVVAKVVAVFAGPSGMAAFGQFQSLVSLLTAFANGGIGTGTVKFLAEHREEPDRRAAYGATSIAIALSASLLIALAFAALARPIAEHVVGDSRYHASVVALAAATLFIGVQVTLQSMLNGLNRMRAFFSSQLAGSLLTVALVLLLMPLHGLEGAFYALALSQVILGVVTAGLALAALGPGLLRPRFNRTAAIQLARFSVMAVTSALVIPLCQIFIRNHLTATISADAAGWWHALWRVSDAYLLFFTSILAVYYLPRLSATTDPGDVRQLVRRAAALVIPLAAASALAVYSLREWLIIILFSPAFLPVADLFLLQFLGDIVKITSWLIAYLMVAKARVGLFVATEIAFTVSFAILVVVFTSQFGLPGAPLAHLVNYLAYLGLLAWIFRREVL